MRKKIIVFFVLAISSAAYSGYGQPVPSESFIDTITVIFKTGDSAALGKYLNSTVELELFNEDNIYSKSQAELMMKNFFTRNKPKSFKVNHEGNKGNTSFAIGTLITSSGNFRVSIFMKIENSKHLIHQIRVERS
ncbi:MAG TPA: DUF4783 domain-containing protein [Perlabentimonas sp.]|nr:DUF4783 domain-containing protein [Bacteroidales bacterium]MDD4672602.1 DUF4783 domain-containing protein [Bacteroidales bacterium]MDY0348112.1 DUF4783 domain-containing protein [Tenuifilaceae bacterium]HZJ73640.1 DUF4783 domain-containing protein [Perlabentimonas sp.]